MEDPTEDPRLVSLVNDERARRTFAERELADARQQLATWRKRARKAEMAARFSLRLPGRDRTPVVPDAEVTGERPVYPAIRAVTSGAPAWFGLLCDTAPLEAVDEAALAGADLVVVGGGEVPPVLRNWLEWSPRQPLIAVAPSGRLAEALAVGGQVDLLVGEADLDAAMRLDVPSIHTSRWPAGASSSAEEVAASLDANRSSSPRRVAQQLLSAAGLDVPDAALALTAVAVTKRADRIAALIDTLGSFRAVPLHVSVGTHGFEMTADAHQRLTDRFGDGLRVAAIDETWPLGKCMNYLMDDVRTPLWAKIDDDDHYGPRYLEEAVAEIDASGADLVGKHTHHLYDTDLDRTYLMESGFEHRPGAYVPGPTFVGRRRTWEEVPFAHRYARIDSTFVRGVSAIGMSVYSTSRFEFALGRGGEDHTWHVDESRYAAKGRLVGPGFTTEEIFLPA